MPELRGNLYSGNWPPRHELRLLSHEFPILLANPKSYSYLGYDPAHLVRPAKSVYLRQWVRHILYSITNQIQNFQQNMTFYNGEWEVLKMILVTRKSSKWRAVRCGARHLQSHQTRGAAAAVTELH